MRKYLVTILVVILIFIGGVSLFNSKGGPSVSPSPRPLPVGEYEYYWGDGCPHCANVAAFLDSWDQKDKITLQKFEVWSDPNNARIMEERYNYCKIEKSQMGVPLLFTPEGECLIGDEPIINFLKNLKL